MNKRTELTRWTSKRLLSLLMALIMTLSLLPTAAFAAEGEDSKILNLSNFVDPSGEGNETWHNVSSGTISDSSLTKYELAVHIDPTVSYIPGMEVTVQAKANLNLATGATVDTSNQLKVRIKGNTHYEKSKADATEVTYTYSSESFPITVGQDGGISFDTKIEYSVIENGDTITGSKLVNVRINDLWTGYTVTYDPDGSTLTNVPSGNTDKTNKQVYTIPAGATASKEGYTFEGWQVSGSGSSATGVVSSGTMIDGITGDITLKANLVPNQPIDFNPVYSGVSGLPYTLKATSTGSTYEILYTPQLANYTFDGWSVTGGTARIDTADPSKVVDINMPITLTPKWVPAGGSTPVGSHSVKFVRNNATDGSALNWPDNLTGAKDSTVTIPWLIPQAEGYTFLGWSTTNAENATAENAYKPGTEVMIGDADITLYAVWQAKNYTITYTPNDSLTGVTLTSTASSITPGRPASFMVTVLAAYDASSMIVAANGVPLGYSTKTENNDGSTTYTYSFVPTGDTAVTVSQPEQKSYVVTLPVGDHFTAKFDGTDTKSDKAVTYNGSVSFTVTADSGWTIEDVSYTGDATLTQDATDSTKYTLTDIKSNVAVSVKMKQIPVYTISYSIDEAYFTSQKVTGESTDVTLITPAERTGYNFDGWYQSPNYTGTKVASLDVTGDVNLYGYYMPITKSISYDMNAPQDANGNSLAVDPTSLLPTEKTYGQAVTLSAVTPTCAGYDFLGWAKARDSKTVVYAAGATVSEELTADMTLYAVWAKKTYTITLQGGSGYTVSSNQALVVEHGSDFTFTVTVDGAYAATMPTVSISNTTNGNLTGPNAGEGTNSTHTAATYTYTISNVTADQVVTVKVTENARANVQFVYRVVNANGQELTNDVWNAKPFMTQAVQLGDPAAQPQQPSIEGYRFVRWCGADHTTATTHTDYDFTKPVAGPLTIYAEITPILPVITVTNALSGDGWELTNWKIGDTPATPTNNRFEVPYGSTITFDLVVKNGYKYDNSVSVAANGYALAPYGDPEVSNDGTTTIHFRLTSVTKDTNISVSGVVRKTITITYNANARDDVSGLPSPQVVKYYLAALGKTGNDKITTQEPKRTGYEFVGWCTDSEATVTVNGDAKTINAKTDGVVVYPGATAPFTTDTTLYAIWLAQDTTLTLKITDAAYDTQQNNRVIQYEGESITLQATLNVNAKGTVVFYKGDKEGTNGTRIGSAAINGKTAELSVKVGDYKAGGVTEHYWAVFESETDEGYANSEKSNIMNVGVFSKALSWKITEGTSNVADNGNVLNVYEGNSATGTPIIGNMVAGRTYTLEVKTASITGVETLDSKQPVLGKDYKIVWQYTEVGKNDWKTDGEASDKATYLVTGDKSGYQFRAQIVPLGPDNGSLFIKAGKFENDALVNDQYDTCLYTKSTNTTVRQATATTLTIDAPEESKDIKINGDTPFTAIGDHKAQFEGQAVTLTATVTKYGSTDGVETGYVKFYRHVDGTNDTLLNTTLISVDANGIATLEVKVSAWDTAKTAIQNLDQFYAVYETNETYETSKSDSEAVYIKSAKLMTPVIESTLAGKLDDTNKTAAQATTYKYNLTELLAGVQHTFTLRQTGAEATTGDWSVVALDGRTVDAGNYDIKWLKTTGSNEQEVDATGTNQIKVDENKVDDRYRVKLTGKGVFAGSEATSKDAVIGTKQNVTVTVKALDAIESTAATDVYQLNEITLTATVAAAKGADATMKPAGTVTFYYKDGDNWVKLDSAALAEDTNHSMTASITTNKLPVTDTTNTWRNVEITAVYEGNDTFNASATVTGTEKYTITAASGCTTTNDTVTVYSSVVFNCEDENKKQPTDGDKGIHISVSDGAFKTNEKATLALSDIYTLDRELTDETLRNTIAKLDPDTDYTVRWQKLNGATAIGDAEGTDFANSKRWTDIGATGTTLVLDKVEQNTAYRAVITVANPATPIVKGSFEKIDQGIVGEKDANDGRQVYYSNVLMPTDTNMTVSVALNTSKIGAENTEGITEGETVTANVFLSGVVGVVPNANVTVKVTNDSAKGNDTTYEKTFTSMNTVNGWNAFSWNTAESDDKGVPTAPGFYTLTVSATTNTGYAAKEITRSLIVRESSYDFEVGNTNPTYNGRTQGLTVALNGFGFKGTGINEAANKSWTVKYYDKDNNLVEPTQAGTYRAVITLPASAYWTEQTKTVDFTIEKRSVSIADAIAQAKVYDGTTDVNIVEVMLNDAVTDQTTNGTGLPTNNVGIINGDSIYAVATAAALEKANAGENKFTISAIDLLGDDANNYVWNEAPYTEDIYVSRSQVYGVSSTDVTLKAGEKLPADAVYMIDQAGNKITTYDVLYYLHTDTEIKKVDNTNEKGLYTVIVRPKQDNYKSGVTLRVTVGDATGYTAAVAPKPSTLITISNTAELYGKSTGVTASTTNDAATTTIEYQSGSTGWTTTAPTRAGRYLVRVTANTGDVAYGIYTITKAHPSIDVTPATGLTYNSMPQNGYTTLTGVEGKDASKDYYITYAGDVAIGYNVQKDGNVDEQAPVDAGTYTVTLHVNETENYTAHEISKSFTIAKKALTIKADSWQTTQYDAFPDMTAGYTGLAAETGDTTPDTSLRDVQIAPEFLYNPKDGKSDYNNVVLDSVGYVAIQPIDALSKNYAITYEKGQYTKQRTETNVDLAIHGLPQSSTGTNAVYYGDVIQLYPYGYYTTHANGSGIFDWSVTTAADFKGRVTIGKETGLLNVNGVGEFTVTLKRGVGEQQIETKLTVTALKKEVKVHVADQDKVYSGSAQTYSGEVKAYDELYATVNAATTTPANNTRTDIGTQITTSRIATGSEKYQSLVYGGKFTINDKEATVAPVAQSTVYGTLEAFDTNPKYTVTGKAGSVDPVTDVNVASQTDAYNRLDVHDGYEILVAGTENMNYNVKYTTDETAEDSAVTTYDGMKLYSTTTKAKNELNDATVYGEQANDLDWILDAVKSTTRDSVDYADNLADFDLPDTFVEQDKDDCTGNKVTYKAANRTTDVSDSNNIKYNQDKLGGPRTSEDTATDENYTLKFNTVENSGAANYKLTNDKTGNSETTTNALTANSKGFIPATGESNDVSGENFVEGSANIAQRPIKLEKAVDDVQLYWKLSQKQLYTALVNVLKAEENSVGRGLAKGHTIEDLDLSFTIGSTPVDKNDDQPMTGLTVGTQTVTVTVGDTNYKLEGSNTFEVDFQTMRIRATYYNKTFTGFDVRIEKIDAAGNSVGPLDSTKGLTFKVLKQTNGVLDTETDYAANKSFTFVSKDGTYGYFHGSYSQLPLLGNGELYVFQMYEYGVPLERK